MTGRSRAGRKPATAPPGRLTLQQVADRAGLTRARVQQLVDSGQLPAELERGAWTVAEADAAQVQRQERPARKQRKQATVWAAPERFERWEREAGGKPVSTWLGELADAACGRSR